MASSFSPVSMTLSGGPGFDIACLHLLVDPTDGVVLGALRRELLQQRKLFSLVGLLADLLEQQAFRRLGVNRAQRMALGRTASSRRDDRCENQGAKSHFRPPFPRNSNTLYNGATVNLPNASFVLRFGPVRDNRIRPNHSGCQTSMPQQVRETYRGRRPTGGQSASRDQGLESDPRQAGGLEDFKEQV